MAPASSVLDNSAALDTEPVQAVEVNLDLRFTVSGEQHEITLPRDVHRLEKLVESLYLSFGEPAVRSLFLALRQRVRSFQAELNQIRPEESADSKVRDAAAKTRQEQPWQRVLDQDNTRLQRQRRLEIGKLLIRRFTDTWEGILAHEGEFLRWYERTLFAASRRLLGDKQKVLQDLWERTYRVGPASSLQDIVDKGVDVSGYRIDPEDPKVREQLFSHTEALAKLWYDYRDSLYSLRKFKGMTRQSTQVDGSMAHVQDVHQRFRELATTLSTVHPTAIVAAKKFEQVLREPNAYAPRGKEREAQLQRCIIESLVEGYEGTQQFGEELAEAMVFGPQSEPLQFHEPDEDYFLRPSTAQLIAIRLTGEHVWSRDEALRSVWTQTPITLRIDQEMAQGEEGTTPPIDGELVPGFSKFLADLDSDQRRLLAASAVPGTYVNRARNEVQRCVDEIRQMDKERLAAVKQSIFAGGVGLAWSTGGASFVVAGALDGIITLSETWDTVLAYRSSSAKAALVMVSTEESYWQTPNLCDHVQKISSAIVTILGDFVNAKAASVVIDGLSMAFMVIDEEPKDGS